MQDQASATGGLKSISESYRVPPHSDEAEQSVLGGIMLDNLAWDKISDIISADDFYHHDHQLIYSSFKYLASQTRPIDVITVSEQLAQQNELDKIGGLSYLGSLAKNTPSAANIAAYADIVRERSILRQMISASNEINTQAFNPEGRPSSELLDVAEQLIFRISERGARGRKNFVPMSELLTQVVTKLEEMRRTGNQITGLATGFTEFDKKTAGLQASDLIIIAGRPSMGKTTFAMNIAETVAIGQKIPVAIFSMEMPAEQLVMRMLSSLSRVDQSKVRSGKLGDGDWNKIISSMDLLNQAPLYIDDTPALSPIELRSRARRLMREHGLGLIVIDYLQLMQVTGSKENRTNEISEISRSLKALAKELKVPVIALSQLNRSLEQRPDKRPIMSDLRESGAIEQDADLITFIYRDEVYNEDSPDKGTAELIISKQRNGPIGMTRVAFHGQYTRFDNLAYDNYGGSGGSSGSGGGGYQ